MAIKVKDLHYAYGKKVILENLSFDLHDQGHLMILGSNGAGKSTLAKLLCALLPFKGSIELNGQTLCSLDAKTKAKTIAYIPSKLESFEQYTTVEDFVLMGRFAYKEAFRGYSDEDRRLVHETLQKLHILDLAPSKIHDLSSGQQQLVLIAQVLAQQSKIIIFDEPTANLDPKNSRFFAQTLRALQADHTTVLITHDLALASAIEGSVLFLESSQGHYFKEAKDFFTPENLRRYYDAPFALHEDILGVSYA